MPIHTRNLPTISKKVLDELVDPNARHERSLPPAEQPSSHDRASPVPREASPPPGSEFEPKHPTDVGSDLPWYRREKWLAVQVAAIVPITSAMLVPAPLRLPLCVLGGALVAIGTVMLLRHKPTPASTGSGSV